MSKTSLFLSSTKECLIDGCCHVNTSITPQVLAHYTRNSLNCPFPSEIMKTTHSDNIVVIVGNAETSKTAPLNAFVYRLT